MTWNANHIYAIPMPNVISAFRADPFLADQIYYVDDLRGVRFDWSRELLLSENPPEDCKHMRHSLPTNGVLVVSPDIYETGYDRNISVQDDFARHYCHNTPWCDMEPAEKWKFVAGPPDVEVFLPAECDPDSNTLNLLRLLKSIHCATAHPIIHYRCSMWGGDIEEEFAWVIDGDEFVYQYRDDATVMLHRRNGQQVVDGDLLQLVMRHVGIDLPTRYFALHESSFHWQLYRLENAA